MRYLCEKEEYVVSSQEREARELFTDGNVIDYENQYGKIVDGILEKTLREKLLFN